ncbi:MAG: multicopper oxidase family protein [Rhabdochlamydiaceae bacterium]|nr:multicopper oxidase family protein [Candidatus Amphrikana amoebophyrae]
MKNWIMLLALMFSSFAFAMPTGTYGPCKRVNKNATRLKIIESEITVNGQLSKVFDIVQEDGSPAIVKKKGGCFNLIVENHTSYPTGLHWHGLILPNSEDGVPYVTQLPISPNNSYSYDFEVVQEGTYWAHTHYGLQEQKLMAAPLILLPEDGAKYKDVIFMFESFTFKSIDEVWQGLRKETISIMKEKGDQWIPTFDSFKPGGAGELNDVNFDAFLTNRRTLADPYVHLVEAGEKIRLRFINGSISSNFHVNIGELDGKIIAVDGNPVEPIDIDKFPIAVAQRVDVLVTIPKSGGAFPILAQCQGRDLLTGAILKTKNSHTPKISEKSKFKAGAVSNEIEKKLIATNPLKDRLVDRTLKVELQGNMKYYVWGINGYVWPKNQPLLVKKGQRIEMVFINNTSMAHPMHLHGHVFQIIEMDGDKFSGAIRDTVLVLPGQTIKVIFDANNPGIWAMHCHNGYHLWGGMFTTVLYQDFDPIMFPKQEIEIYSKSYGGY